jgi:2-polyprenyl-3-methyl-5-hydroxy-6-metoxy-1,4-benzoquinol methylase
VALVVFGVPYHRCGGCGHVFVRSQPTAEALARHFASSEELAAVYTDREAVEVRLAEVARPKLSWLQEIYRGHYGHAPASVLDVGAGGGHFVAAARAAGLAAEGLEPSTASRRFAAKTFGLELLAEDFLGRPPEPGAYDVVTFWGLLEYTPEPRRFLEQARAWLTPERGLLVVEVPRYDCLGSAVQRARPETVARHLDPTSHVNCFSDASLAAALAASGLAPVAAWYYGLDAFELLVQTALALDDEHALERLAEPFLALQPVLDEARLCDDLVLAAVPSPS